MKKSHLLILFDRNSSRSNVEGNDMQQCGTETEATMHGSQGDSAHGLARLSSLHDVVQSRLGHSATHNRSGI